MERVDRIYSQWKAYFDETPNPEMLMDPQHQDGYFSTEVAESAKGETVRDFKKYFQFYPWGVAPQRCVMIYLLIISSALILRRYCYVGFRSIFPTVLATHFRSLWIT